MHGRTRNTSNQSMLTILWWRFFQFGFQLPNLNTQPWESQEAALRKKAHQSEGQIGLPFLPVPRRSAIPGSMFYFSA